MKCCTVYAEKVFVSLMGRSLGFPQNQESQKKKDRSQEKICVFEKVSENFI